LHIERTSGVGKSLLHLLQWRRILGNTAGEALDLSRRVVEQDSGDAFAQAIYGQALTLIVGDCAQGRLHAEEAVRLNPSSAFAWSAMGFVGDLAGEFDAAIDSFQLALRLSPSDTFLYWWMTGLAAAQFALRRYEDAVASARGAVQRHPSFGIPEAGGARVRRTLGMGVGLRDETPTPYPFSPPTR
jgi:tetratricopeptide (TPR) repeat protein